MVFSQQHSFKPRINKKSPNFHTTDPIKINGIITFSPGYAKYIEQMDNAKRAKYNEEERKREVFISGSNWSKERLFTIPKPFQLSCVSIKLF